MRRSSEAGGSCRIERKRAHDREAQRASRAKTKAYIAHLEKTVADLTESSGDGRANYLAQHASQQSHEIDRLQAIVGKIRSLVQEAVPKPEHDSPGPLKTEGTVSGESSSAQPTDDVFSADTHWESPGSEDQWIPDAPKQPEPDEKKVSLPPPATSHCQELQAPRRLQHPHRPLKTETSTRNLIVLGISLHCEPTDDSDYFQRLNTVIAKLEQTPDNLSTLEEDNDILVRAIANGWDAAERVHHFDIVWRFLRAFDEGLWYYHAQPVERLAHLWHMRTTMVHRINPKNQERRPLATFMKYAAAQESASYQVPPIAHYFGWPQVRNIVKAKGVNNTTGKASIAFAQNFRFAWPWEMRDIYKINRATGLYSLSEAFLRNFNDLSCFRMMQSDLVPFYVNNSLQVQTKLPHLQQQVPTFSSATRNVNEEPAAPRTAVEAVVAQTEQLMQTDASAEEWMSSFNSAIVEQYEQLAMYPFQAVHEPGLMQWPAV